MKKITAIILLLVICLSFSGCEFGFLSVESLMRPPKLSGEDELLQSAFDKSVSEYESVVMKTPITGKYRSSYIIFDIDNDGNDEAIVLYSIPTENNFSFVQLFKNTGTKWLSVAKIKGTSEEIYEVNFADLNGDGHYEILLSWKGGYSKDINIDTSYRLSQTLNVYSFDGQETDLIMTETYTNLFIKDLDNSKADEIVILKTNLTNIDNRTSIRLLSFNDDYSIYHDNTTYITDMVEIYNIVSERVVLNQKAYSRIYVDGVIGEFDIATEIVEIDESNFNINLPLYDDNKALKSKTIRNSKVSCNDIDGDGHIEIPTIDVYPYSQKISDGKNETVNIVVWLEYGYNKFSIDFKSIINSEIGYLMAIPDELFNNISVIYDEDNLNLTFYSIDSNGTYISALFSCKVFTKPEWEENNFNYKKIVEDESYVYGCLIFKTENREIYEKYVSENFYAI